MEGEPPPSSKKLSAKDLLSSSVNLTNTSRACSSKEPVTKSPASSEYLPDEISESMLSAFTKNEKDRGEENHGHASRFSSQAFEKIFAAFFYGATSLAVIFTNKQIMTGYDFPYFDFLAAVQFLATTLILTILICMKKLDVPPLTPQIFREIFPISCMFLGNVICGLGSTRTLNLPMMTALRRFSILMTMVAEFFIIGTKPALSIVISVAMMVGGALFAASFDISFDAWGYTLVFLNNIFTTMNGVWMKKASMGGKCSKMGVLYYNSLFSGVAMFLFFAAEHWYFSNLTSMIDGGSSLAHPRLRVKPVEMISAAVATASRRLLDAVGYSVASSNKIPIYEAGNSALQANGAIAAVPPNTGIGAAMAVAAAAVVNKVANEDLTAVKAAIDLDRMSTLSKILEFNAWHKPDFLGLFMAAAVLGSVLNYSIFFCTTVNSALTTAVVGCLKNVLTTYIGMIVFPDYIFQWWNFIGLNISIAGSLYYTYVTLFKGLQGFGQ